MPMVSHLLCSAFIGSWHRSWGSLHPATQYIAETALDIDKLSRDNGHPR
jgi:hypothetical protein